MMFRFVKKVFCVAMTFFRCNPLNVNSLECVSMNNQERKIKAKIIDINNNESTFYVFSISLNKYSESWNNINDPYAKLRVLDIVKNINVKVFNLMSRSNGTKHVEWHETCKCKLILDPSVCNNKQKWNNEKCRWECRELIKIGRRDKGFVWNHSDCDCECDKSCDVGEYLDFKNCKCRKKIDELVEEFSGNIDGNEMIYNSTLNNYENLCNSCTV